MKRKTRRHEDMPLVPYQAQQRYNAREKMSHGSRTNREKSRMSKLAQLIAQEEGFNVPGSLPNRDDNPGDLRHSPHSFHNPDAPDAVGIIDTPQDGWADLERQLQLYAQRGLTLQEAIFEFAPEVENDTAKYLQFICNGLGLPPTASVQEALEQT